MAVTVAAEALTAEAAFTEVEVLVALMAAAFTAVALAAEISAARVTAVLTAEASTIFTIALATAVPTTMEGIRTMVDTTAIPATATDLVSASVLALSGDRGDTLTATDIIPGLVLTPIIRGPGITRDTVAPDIGTIPMTRRIIPTVIAVILIVAMTATVATIVMRTRARATATIRGPQGRQAEQCPIVLRHAAM